MRPQPYVFDEFFASNLEENISPFLTRNSRRWGKNIILKSSILSAFLLIIAFLFSFTNPPISNLFLSSVYFLMGTPAIINALQDLQNLEININMLMTLAAFLALAIGSQLEGALLLVLFEISGALENTVNSKARSAIVNLHKLSPQKGLVLMEDGSTLQKPLKEIEIGEHLLVKAGEIVPLDGKVTMGRSSVSLLHLTGEPLPVLKKIGDEVPSGARNIEGTLTIKVIKTRSNSTLTKIIQLILQAQESKPKIQLFMNKFGKIYSTSIVTLTLLLAIFLPFIVNLSYFGKEGAIYRSIAFLIAASPCALIIATPISYLSAISACARNGIILKGGEFLDALTKCSTIAFDKTGTLTKGDLTCTSIEPIDSSSKINIEKALSIAEALEKNSTHPIAKAVVKLAQSKKVPKVTIENFRSIGGYGVEGKYISQQDTIYVYMGLPQYLEDKITKETIKKLHKIQKTNFITSILLIKDEIFLFHFTDTVRKNSKQVIEEIKKNLTPLMLTGDNFQNANFVAQKIGLEKIFANLRPEDKLKKVTKLSLKGGLAMVGDGINDAPALARATVGISMGKIGSATAVDASDIVLLNDNLSLISWVFKKARATLKIVKENLTLSLLIIFCASIPALLGLVPLWLAITLHEGGTLLVGLNSLRLLRK